MPENSIKDIAKAMHLDKNALIKMVRENKDIKLEHFKQ